MPTTTATWGWWNPGGLPNAGTDDLGAGQNGYVFTIGQGTSVHEYGTMTMIDGDDDGRLSFVQGGGTSPAPGNGDRFQLPDGTNRQLYEMAIYDNSVYTYLDGDGVERTYSARAVVYQLGNGDLVLRLRDDDRNAAPADFFIENVTSVQLGTWDGTDYQSSIVGNFDAPPPNVCFANGTLIETDRGPVAVEELRAGDLVVTRDAGLQPIRWIGSKKLGRAVLEGNPGLRPIRIRAGALGGDTPTQDLLVSPQHRVLVRSKTAQRMFGASEVLVGAKQLLMLDGIDVADDLPEVEYFHFLFDDHQVVISNGAETESLYTGPQALRSVGPAALEEIFAIFPELRDRDPAERPQGARMLLSGRQGRRLAHRHAQHAKPLVM